MRQGYWPLRNSNPTLYTRKAADIIKHKATGKEYIRGKMVMFDDAEAPQVIEAGNEYSFIYIKKNDARMTDNELLTELYVTEAMKRH